MVDINNFLTSNGIEKYIYKRKFQKGYLVFSTNPDCRGFLYYYWDSWQAGENVESDYEFTTKFTVWSKEDLESIDLRDMISMAKRDTLDDYSFYRRLHIIPIWFFKKEHIGYIKDGKRYFY